MFTGIIETTGNVNSLETSGSNISYWIESALAPELKVDQSLSHNGVCLTVEAINGPLYRVTAIEETLLKTNLGKLTVGQSVNLERCMTMHGRIDGHIVQGHVDDTAICVGINRKEGSTEFRFRFNKKFAALVIEKGSISVNGISLTVFNVTDEEFTVAIIPYTYEHTNMKDLGENDQVNIEFDMIGKYVNRIASLK